MLSPVVVCFPVTIAAAVFVTKGVEGVARLHKAIIARDIKKIQRLLDN